MIIKSNLLRKNINGKSILQCIFIFIILYISSSMFAREEISGSVRVIGTLLIILILLLVKKFNIKINIRLLGVFLVLLCIQFLSMSILGFDIDLSIGSVISLVSAFIFVSIISFDSFTASYRKVLYFLSFFSCIVYVITIINPNIFSIFPQYSWHFGIKFKNLFFCIVPISTINHRNYGIFYEAGMFQIYINYALYLELFFSDNPKKRYIIIYLLTIITTISTNGIIVAALLSIAYMLKNNIINNRIDGNKRRIVIYIIIIFVIAFIMLKKFPQYKYVFEKINEMSGEASTAHGSGGERWRSIFYAFDGYIDNMILGMGMLQFTKKFSGIIMTCTPLNWFTLYGTVYGLICNYFYLMSINKIDENKLTKIVLIISLILMIFSQEMSSNLFIYILIFYGVLLSTIKNKNTNNAIEINL